MPITVFIADSQEIFREGLCALMAQEYEFGVIGQAGDGRSAVEQVARLSPQVVLMDTSLPELNGIEATRHITKNQPNVKVLAFSAYRDVPVINDALRAGSAGYLLKTCNLSELKQAIRTVANGQTYLSPQITQVVVGGYLNPHRNNGLSLCPQLSPREAQVLQLLAEGKTTRQIGAQLEISQKTVSIHRNNIMNKLKLKNAVDLIHYAIKSGLTSLK